MTDPTHPDEALLARLRAADPAAQVPPAGAEAARDLLASTMAHDPHAAVHADPHHETRETGTRDRSLLTWLVAAAAAVLILGAGTWAVLRAGADDPVPAVRGDESPSPSVTALEAPRASAGRCMVPDPDVVAAQTVAFEGEAVSVGDEVVTLVPTRWFAGEETAEVLVQAPADRMRLLLGAVQFEEGEDYLVSATNGVVTLCGLTGPATLERRALYEEAFPD